MREAIQAAFDRGAEARRAGVHFSNCHYKTERGGFARAWRQGWIEENRRLSKTGRGSQAFEKMIARRGFK